MNALVDQFGDKLAVLGVPSNQFGHQTNENDAEFPNTLKYVRPGGGFEFKGELFACSKVNGELQVPIKCSVSTLNVECGHSFLHSVCSRRRNSSISSIG